MAVPVERLLLSLRSKLGDTVADRPRYNDAALIDAVNAALSWISTEALPFRKTWEIETIDGVQSYRLPDDWEKRIAVYIDGEQVHRVISEEENHRAEGIYVPYAVIDAQTIAVYTGSAMKAGRRIKLHYYHQETVSDARENIPLSAGWREPIVYYALSELMLNPNKKDGMNRSQYYLGLAEKKAAPLKSRLASERATHSIRVPYRSV
ncbi:MAG: hypothetical protein HF962_00520 [Sulfurovum sp.]|nr:hypothetical protein [Sulfurovum sp.]